MKPFAPATLFALASLALGCLDTRIQPVLPPPDGGTRYDADSGRTESGATPDGPSPVTLPLLYAVAGNSERVCVAGENLVACKVPGDSFWQTLPLEFASFVQLTGIAIDEMMGVVAVGHTDGRGVVLGGQDTLKPLDSADMNALYDVARVGEVFVAVGENVDASGTLGPAAWQIRGERIDPWSVFDAGNTAQSGPLRAIWSDGFRVAVVGDELWTGDVQGLARADVRADLAADVLGLSDGSTLVLGQRGLHAWRAPNDWVEIPFTNDEGRALHSGLPTAGGQPVVYVLGAASLSRLASVDLTGENTLTPVTIEGLDEGVPLDMHDLWISGDRAVLVGSRLLASCDIIQMSDEASTLFSCRRESIEASTPPPPPPPPSCVEIEANGNQCAPLHELRMDAEQRCASEAKQLMGVLPIELCTTTQELLFSRAAGYCCAPDVGGCEQADLSDGGQSACLTLDAWLQRGDELCRQRGAFLRGINLAEDCGNGTFSVLTGTCCQ